jgi:hemerythrin-like domain-containing protein
MNELSPIAALRQDHVEALAETHVLVADTLGLEEADWSQVKEKVANQFSDLRRLLLRHFQQEEQALYPEVIQLVSEGAPEVDILADFFQEATDADLAAHGLLRSRLHEVATLLARMEPPGEDFASASAALQTTLQFSRNLLSRHAEKEETLVFPILERLLDEKQMAAVRERMAAVQKGAVS